jgi:hypothetical protein
MACFVWNNKLYRLNVQINDSSGCFLLLSAKYLNKSLYRSEDGKDGTCSNTADMKILHIRTFGRKIRRVRLRTRCRNNIKMDIQEIWSESVNWIVWLRNRINDRFCDRGTKSSSIECEYLFQLVRNYFSKRTPLHRMCFDNASCKIWYGWRFRSSGILRCVVECNKYRRFE